MLVSSRETMAIKSTMLIAESSCFPLRISFLTLASFSSALSPLSFQFQGYKALSWPAFGKGSLRQTAKASKVLVFPVSFLRRYYFSLVLTLSFAYYFSNGNEFALFLSVTSGVEGQVHCCW